MSNTPPVTSYGNLLAELKARIHKAQYAALRAVNKELIALYWDIGKLIEERQKVEGWGKAVVERLSADLRTEFGEKSGFSVQNLWYMRKFYREYNKMPNLQPLAGEISWTKNTLILDRCPDPLQREFYLRATARFGWTRRVLEHQIENQTYEKYLLNQTSFDKSLPQAVAAQAKLADENDAIGIIICKSKKKTVVEYALKTTTQPIGIATYSLTPHLPAAYKNLLPTEGEIKKRLQGWLENNNEAQANRQESE